MFIKITDFILSFLLRHKSSGHSTGCSLSYGLLHILLIAGLIHSTNTFAEPIAGVASYKQFYIHNEIERDTVSTAGLASLSTDASAANNGFYVNLSRSILSGSAGNTLTWAMQSAPSTDFKFIDGIAQAKAHLCFRSYQNASENIGNRAFTLELFIDDILIGTTTESIEIPGADESTGLFVFDFNISNTEPINTPGLVSLRITNISNSNIAVTEPGYVTNHGGIKVYSLGPSSSDLCYIELLENTPSIELTKQTSVISDPINGNLITGSNNPKAIPNATVKYIITTTNTGLGTTDNNSLQIVDAIPENTVFSVADITTTGGPIQFEDPLSSSGLTYNFISLDSTEDSLEFSNNNATNFNYTPTPDSDGFDENITHIRITPVGIFAAALASNPLPSFHFYYTVKLK